LHVAGRVRAAALQRDHVIDDVAAQAPVARFGALDARRTAVLRWNLSG
jgi:hypothetical protein